MCHTAVINSCVPGLLRPLWAPDDVPSCTDLLVVLLFGLEAVVSGLKPQVDMREIVKPVSPPGRNVIHPSRRHPCPEKKLGCSLNKPPRTKAGLSGPLPEVLIPSHIKQRP